MAVDDFLCRDTDTFVLPSKTFYPLSIPLSHYQLRHFISSPEQDLIYYANGQYVYCLNTVTKTQTLIATLTFDARCTAAGYGWVCVGGAEDGCFAAIKVEAYPPPNPTDVDALLPLDLPNRTTIPPPPTLRSASSVRVERIGSEIVNSISIHKLHGEAEEEDEVVAVLTSNDKTVRIYSLTQSVEVAELKLPFAMNHATISPDGQLLIAVGDYQQVFFFERLKTPRPSMMKTPEGRPQSLPVQWSNFAEAQLYVPPGSVVAGYFTTAWSPSGALCAVGSECGYITVFDTELLKECDYAEDAVVQVVKSSRPDSTAGPGAVRTMLFSPQPWDLLVWSEDQARVCVADIRSGLSVKQVLALDPMDDDLEKIDIADFDIEMPREAQQTQSELRDISDEADFIRRYRRALDPEVHTAASNYATDYLEAAADRRRLHRQLGVVESDNDPHGLTPDERQVLDAIMTRQRDGPRETGTPRSIRYPNTSDLGLFRTAFNNSSSERSERTSAGQNTSSHGRGDFTDYVRVRSLLRERAERALDPERASYQPRRQASVVLSGGRSSAANNGSTDSLTGTPTSRSPNPIPPHARRAESSESSSSDPWRTIEAAMARSALPESLPPRAPAEPSQAHRIRQLQAARDRIRSLRDHPGSDYEIAMMRQGPRRQTAGAHDPRSDPHNGVRTAGLAMSQDGRKLYAGTEDGIFEFNINLRERKLFPAIVPR